MKVSLKWLSEYVDVPTDLKAFCDKLDLTGTGVEGVEKLGASFDNIVTGQVLTKEPHPDSDHMWVTTVSVGDKNVDAQGNPEPLQIVCGAQNFNAGDHIVVAMIGAVLPGDFKIKKSKLRGVVSMGMNCSARELGLGSDHEGIMILPKHSPLGVPLAEFLQLGDTVLDLEITPNRPDCLSIQGFAREVGAMYGAPVKDALEEMCSSFERGEFDLDASLPLAIDVQDEVRCPRYTARVIRNVKVGPSPDWMVERLTAIGQRSINNIVDVTNYILFLFGQPLHAFDYDKLRNEQGDVNVVIRAAEDGEELVTLDGEKRTLTSDMTVIATPERGAVALAGVMGGLDTEVTEETTTILLEAATFEPGRTSRTSRNLGLISESSMRYERRVDDHGIDVRSAAAAALIAEVSGGVVLGAGENKGFIDVYPAPSNEITLEFRIPRFCAMMGAQIETDFIVDTLRRLGCAVAQESDELLKVVAPTFRPDLEREIDLYEEVLRLYGMDRIPATLPGGRGRVGTRSPLELMHDKVHATMQASGLNETMTYSFADSDEVSKLRMSAEAMEEPVELINPMNSEQALMRRTILPGLLGSVAYNQSHGVPNIQLYEVGNVFFAQEDSKIPQQVEKLCGVLAGAMGPQAWNNTPATFDFFDGKGVVESLARELALPKLRFKVAEGDSFAFLQPGRAAQVLSGKTQLGWVGEVHPLVCDAYGAQAPVVAFELDMKALLAASRPARDYKDVPTFPAVTMDVAFVVDEDVPCEKLMQVMSSSGGKMLDTVSLFDVYRDEERLGAGKKSMAFALEYRAADRTLTGEEVEKSHAKLIKKVCGATGAELR